jgi:hypothetical protein
MLDPMMELIPTNGSSGWVIESMVLSKELR